MKTGFGLGVRSPVLLAVISLVFCFLCASRAASGRGPADHSSASPAQEQVIRFGRSAQGRPLLAFVLGQGTDETLILGGVHGNERSGPGVVEKLHIYLLQHPNEWLNRKVILVPYANPDGWKAGTRVNARQVDLNRNFPGTWKPSARKDRHSPGPSPASESETRAIIGLLARYSPAKVISIHQPLHLLNWTGPAGRHLAAVMARYNHYRISNDIGYATPGALGGYCGKRGIAIVTLEMPAGSVSQGWQQNREALMAAITSKE